MKRTHLRDTHWTRERPNAFVAAMGGGGPDRRMVMHFPPRAEYVNVHDTCLHLHDAEATS